MITDLGTGLFRIYQESHAPDTGGGGGGGGGSADPGTDPPEPGSESEAEPAAEPQGGGEPAGEPSEKNVASEKLRKDYDDLNGRHTETSATLDRVLKGLQQIASGGDEPGPGSAPAENPYDEFAESEKHAEWNQNQADARARNVATQATSTQVTVELRRRDTAKASTEFLSQYPDLRGDGPDGFDAKVFESIGPLARDMFLKGQGSGEGGALTVDDYKWLAQRNNAAAMSTMDRRRSESSILEEFKGAEGSRPTGGSGTDVSTMSIEEIEAMLPNLSGAQADVILGRLTDSQRAALL